MTYLALLAALALAPLALMPPVSAAPARTEAPAKQLPRNFHTVHEGMYRGGKIESRAQLQHLRDVYGVRTVVCLAKDSLGPEGDNELTWAPELGLKVVKAYLGDQPPDPEKWERIKLAMVTGQVYVHCKWGADRTGAIVAKYRQEEEGWDARRAFAEARKYGFKPWLKDLRSWIAAPADM